MFKCKKNYVCVLVGVLIKLTHILYVWKENDDSNILRML